MSINATKEQRLKAANDYRTSTVALNKFLHDADKDVKRAAEANPSMKSPVEVVLARKH